CERCQCHGEDKHTAILYSLLSQNLHPGRARQRCLCHQRRTVRLCTPHVTCQAASAVLVKTASFIKNLPSFHQLPREDQLLLLDSCWVPLFLLGLVQEMVTFEVMEAPAPSMLKKILLSGQSKGQEPERTQPTLAAVQRLQCCLNTFRSLDLSPKEYAYLKGAILFNPDIPGLRASLQIQSLQREAQQALQELPQPLPSEEQGRHSHILVVSSTLKSIPPTLITDLFFRPVLGDINIVEMLYEV
ncbi:NR0B2 protein, partial [Grallaria varia]|nr:NR0B2 protein [Grallaria varia]